MSSSNQTLVIKCGGSILNNSAELDQLSQSLAQLHHNGYNLIIVHGGGPEINYWCQQLGIQPTFHNGLRQTTAEVLKVTQMALLGISNPELVKQLNQHHLQAIGIAAHNNGLLTAKPIDINQYGYVGKISAVNPELIYQLWELKRTPVIAPLARDSTQQILNINADLAAAAIAQKVAAAKLILLSDIDGYYSNYPDQTSLVSQLKLSHLEQLLSSYAPSITSGMRPKLEACLTAVTAGVTSAHILNINQAPNLLSLVRNQESIGTTISQD